MTTAQLDSLNSTLVGLQGDVALHKTAADATAEKLKVAMKETDTFYILFAGCLVFLMQCGFATLEAGSVRDKNVRNVLLKNALDACVGAIVWYLFGFGIAGAGNAFIGSDSANFALSGLDDTNSATYTSNGYDWISFFFSFTFAAAASTIVSGAVAERCQLSAYLIYTIFITGFIYPVVVHWVWTGDGFLSAFNTEHIVGGVIDFAGSGVVHMTGGVAGLVGAKFLGPRLGRFENPDEFDGHSTPLQVIGTFLLWFGWYGFNGGSTLYINGYGRDMARVAVTTTLSAAMSGATGLLIKKFFPLKMGGDNTYSVGHTCNSILAGLVGITAGCCSVSAGASIAIGFLSAFVYHGASCLMRKLKIDDPLDAFAVHGATGFWGCVAVGLMASPNYSYVPNTGNSMYTAIGGYDSGAFAGGSKGAVLGGELVGLIIEIVWVGGMSCLLFGGLKVTGMLRVSKEIEEAGLDSSKHGGRAYTTQGVGRSLG
jgi:Amt family ammonium transporter